MNIVSMNECGFADFNNKKRKRRKKRIEKSGGPVDFYLRSAWNVRLVSRLVGLAQVQG